ncbi:hypothetical protein [Flavobacterium sp. J27]|uniref:hypothetical protein n=1 Tax=Flavobacterium sp. J27 TaxID=2060419 RepID=UPI001031C417|nr:hypothetical protein [Flavobacterium sp. J27]
MKNKTGDTGATEFKNLMTKFGLPNSIIVILSKFSQAIANGKSDQQLNDLETILRRKTTPLFHYLKATYQ